MSPRDPTDMYPEMCPAAIFLRQYRQVCNIPVAIQCPQCGGTGRDLRQGNMACRVCQGQGKAVNPAVAQQQMAWHQRLQNTLPDIIKDIDGLYGIMRGVEGLHAMIEKSEEEPGEDVAQTHMELVKVVKELRASFDKHVPKKEDDEDKDDAGDGKSRIIVPD